MAIQRKRRIITDLGARVSAPAPEAVPEDNGRKLVNLLQQGDVFLVHDDGIPREAQVMNIQKRYIDAVIVYDVKYKWRVTKPDELVWRVFIKTFDEFSRVSVPTPIVEINVVTVNNGVPEQSQYPVTRIAQELEPNEIIEWNGSNWKVSKVVELPSGMMHVSMARVSVLGGGFATIKRVFLHDQEFRCHGRSS